MDDRGGIRLGLAFLTALLAATSLSGTSAASTIIGRNATGVSLQVNRNGEALVSYKTQGKLNRVLVWGAVNAFPSTVDAAQVAFKIDYTGGYKTHYLKNRAVKTALARLRSLQARMATATAARNNPARYALKPKIAAAYATLARLRRAATSFTNACTGYTGPSLHWLVTACTAPDKSYWALQAWQRALPNYGLAPTPTQAAWELHLSHWTGQIATLTIKTDWAWNRWDHLYGTFAYGGEPVYGFHSTPTGQPLDAFGRNVYVDTLDSAYGSGWMRENSFLTHNPTGAFCYSVNPHNARVAGKGTRYRATIIGPGVTPDVYWEGTAPGGFDKDADGAANAEINEIGDKLCRGN